MTRRHIYDDELHAQFVTFSCYRRRRLLDDAQARQAVIGVLAEELAKSKGVHSNPVRAGLVEDACQWRWSSARHYELGESVGVPLEWIF